ncbi:MAG: hypothetical protein DMG79_02565 [Acidobacteria bacterium]|nr:MAG: hypothetical protein DMG79_02565 [Acidobacteriota bacterium]
MVGRKLNNNLKAIVHPRQNIEFNDCSILYILQNASKSHCATQWGQYGYDIDRTTHCSISEYAAGDDDAVRDTMTAPLKYKGFGAVAASNVTRTLS